MLEALYIELKVLPIKPLEFLLEKKVQRRTEKGKTARIG